MTDLTTYSLPDLIPVTRDVYLRLFVRQNLLVWPAQLPALLVGTFILYRTWKKQFRWTGVMLALIWAWVGVTFHLRLYANLNWGATYIGYAFVLQAGLLLIWEWLKRSPENTLLAEQKTASCWQDAVKRRTGISVILFSLVIYPLIAPLAARSWLGCEVFGIAPDPTVLFTLGILLLLPRPRCFLTVVPLLWCLVSAAHAWVLDIYGGMITGLLGIAITGYLFLTE